MAERNERGMRKFSCGNWAMVGWTQLGRTDDMSYQRQGLCLFVLGAQGVLFSV